MASGKLALGPAFVRNAILKLSAMCPNPAISGWREIDPERVADLVGRFFNGEFGMAVLCNSQVMALG